MSKVTVGGNKVRISISLFGSIMLVALWLSHSYISLAALIAAALHEAGHIIAAKVLKIELYDLKLGIFGASLGANTLGLSYGAECILAFSGPFMNILCAVIGSLSAPSSDFSNMFISASIFLAALNLLPIKDLDGGRITYSLIANFASCKVAERIIEALSFVIIFSVWCLSVYLMIRRGASLSLFIFSSALFCKIFVS